MCKSQPCIEELVNTAMKEEFETNKAEVEGDVHDKKFPCPEPLDIFSSDIMLQKIAEKVMGKELTKETFETTVTKVEKEEVQMLSQINVELECAVPKCNFGGQGTKYKTPPLLHHQALQLRERHRADAHDLGGAEVASDHDVLVDAVIETVCKPVLLKGCSVGQFKSFQVAWALYAAKYSQEYRSQLKEQYWVVDETTLLDFIGCIILRTAIAA